jgi:hypothetical protein
LQQEVRFEPGWHDRKSRAPSPLPDTTDIRPVRERLAAALGGSEGERGYFVGRHFGRRSNLVHGNARREVKEQEVESVRDLVQALLELELGIGNDERRESLRSRAGITAKR